MRCLLTRYSEIGIRAASASSFNGSGHWLGGSLEVLSLEVLEGSSSGKGLSC